MGAEIDKNLTKQVFDFLHEEGGDAMGIAPVERFEDAPQGYHPRDILRSSRNVVVIGMRQIDSVVDNLPASRYTFSQHYHILTRKLDDLAISLSKFLEQKGYKSIQIPAEGFYDKKTMHGHLYHDGAAVLAGLGEIGLNNLLLTPKFGPRIQLVSVVNDAPLEGSPVLGKGLCKEWQKVCNKACITACPANCISENGFKKELCFYYHDKFLSEGLHIYIPKVLCGLCVKACPRQLPR
jgi:epoxyqueuosine reductase QueG